MIGACLSIVLCALVIQRNTTEENDVTPWPDMATLGSARPSQLLLFVHPCWLVDPVSREPRQCSHSNRQQRSHQLQQEKCSLIISLADLWIVHCCQLYSVIMYTLPVFTFAGAVWCLLDFPGFQQIEKMLGVLVLMYVRKILTCATMFFAGKSSYIVMHTSMIDY